LLPKPLWDKYIQQGCTDPLIMLNNSICSTYFLKFSKLIGNLNPYALEFPVCVEAQQVWFSDYLFDRANMENANRESESESESESETQYTISPVSVLYDSIPLSDTYEPCEDNWAQEYLNQPDVKNALNVRSDIVWEECSRTTKYELVDKMRSTVRFYRQILDDKSVPDLRVMIYSGDLDGVCGTVYTQSWLFDLGYDYESNFLWEAWYVQGQTAGYITKFRTPYSSDSRLTFATVHGAGHEVPTYKPEEAFVLFQAWLTDNFDM
jgi:carboxypeptidase C (cathepsin A)